MKVLEGKAGGTEAGSHNTETCMRCPKEYQYEFVRGIKIPKDEEIHHFAVGTLVHAGRAKWLALGCSSEYAAWKLVQKAIKKAVKEAKTPINDKAITEATSYVEQFIDHWKLRTPPRCIATELKLGPAPLTPNDPFPTWRTARLDDLSYYPEAGNALCIGDCKTTSGDISDEIRKYELHPQPLQYAAVYKNAPEGEARHGPISAFVLDVIKKPSSRRDHCSFGRVVVMVDPPPPWFARDMRNWVQTCAPINWNTDVPRNLGSCVRRAGRMLIDCPYKPLCRFGKSSALLYVTADGKPVSEWKPTAQEVVPPWE